MPQVLDWQNAESPQELAAEAVRALRGGRLVALPTETVYGVAASALAPQAVERLARITERPEDRPFPLAVRGGAEALDWVPAMSALGRRLARRCWPGPVTLVFGDGVEHGLASRLPEAVRRRVCPAGTLGLRTPAHEAVLETLRRLAGPLVLTGAGRGAADAAGVVEALGDAVDVVVDGGRCRFGQPSTVVRVNGGRWDLLREGVVGPALLQKQCVCLILFVCTGNTCRSPLAEGLCKKLLADRLGCAVEELAGRGFLVLSAGTSAMMGGPAAEEAVVAAEAGGADLRSHRSRPLTAELAAQADYLLVMTRGHQLAVAEQFGGLGVPPRLLDPDGADISDPIGGDQPVYQECAAQLRRHLERFVAELPPECFSPAGQAGAG